MSVLCEAFSPGSLDDENVDICNVSYRDSQS